MTKVGPKPVSPPKVRAPERAAAAAAASATGDAAPQQSHASPDRFAGTGRGAVDRPAAKAQSDKLPAATLVPRERTAIDVPSASGVVALDRGRFLIVDDDKGIYLQGAESAERVKSTKKHEQLGDLEGICRTPEGDGVLVVNEETGNVYRLDLEKDKHGVDLGKPDKVGRLPKLSKKGSNKGWEGIDVVPGKFFDDREPRLVAVHEGSPKRVGVFAFPDLEEGVLLALPRDVEKKLKDLSDVAVDPKTGHLFVLSDESELIVELRITKKTTNAPGALLESLRLETVGTHEVDAKKGEKPEGLDFGPDGTLWLAMDGRSSLLAFDVER